MGTLSALPIVSAGNLCCCLWVVCGGLVAAYVLQQNQVPSITPGDGALAGLLAGIVGAVFYLLLSIPITLFVAPMERELMQRFLESAGGMRPEFRTYVSTYVGGVVRLAIGFLFMLVVGSSFSTIGGVLGALVFRKQSYASPHA
jgi:hypothetical protein